MRRSPFYAYPSFPHTFFAPPAEEAAYHHRPRRPFPAPTPGSSSVINIPVFDSPPSRPSSSFPPQKQPNTPPPSSPPAFDPSSAATTIQSCFRGFCVRKNRPLLHLRYIAKARKQLEELQSELQSPGFPLKVRASEKERLRFSESVMAIILRLDAVEGSMAEVRSQRKEATKMAIKLQDAVDAIMMEKDDIADLQPTDGPSSNGAMASEDVLCEQSEEPLCPDTDMVLCPDTNMVQGGAHAISEEGIMNVNAVIQRDESSYLQPTDDPCSDGDMAPEEDSVLCEQSEEPLFCPDVDLAQGGAHAVSEEGIMNVNTMDDESIAPEDVVADMVDENVSQLLPSKAEDVGLHILSCELLMSKSEQDMSHVTGENAGGDDIHVAEEEGNNCIEALHSVAHNNQIHNNALVAKVEQGDDMKVANHGSAKGPSSDVSYTCMDVVQECEEGSSQDVELCTGTPTAGEKCDQPWYSNAAHQSLLQAPSLALERRTEGNCYSDGKDSTTLHRHGCENCSEEAYKNQSDELNPCDDARALSSTLSMVGKPSPPDSAILHQLSEDCRQLKSLVCKLIVQNKAQSKVLCALGERLELLEHQQQLKCQHNQQQIREKRKLKKGSKRSTRCRNCE